MNPPSKRIWTQFLWWGSTRYAKNLTNFPVNFKFTTHNRTIMSMHFQWWAFFSELSTAQCFILKIFCSEFKNKFHNVSFRRLVLLSFEPKLKRICLQHLMWIALNTRQYEHKTEVIRAMRYCYVNEKDLLLHQILSPDQKLENALMCNNSGAIDRVQRSTIHRGNHNPTQATVCNFFLVFETSKWTLLRRGF